MSYGEIEPAESEKGKRLSGPGWHWLGLSGPLKTGFDEVTFELKGLRSDGTFFNTYMKFHPVIDNIDMRALNFFGAKLQNALMTFDTFRACACKLGQRCDTHKAMYGA